MKSIAHSLLILSLGSFFFIGISSPNAPLLAQDSKPSTEEKPLKPGPDDSEEIDIPGEIDKDAPREFKTTESGLKYRILRKSEGKKPDAKASVTCHYKGWTDDGKIFDSSYRRGKTSSFPLRNVIKGWTEGLQLVGEEGMIELEIPYELGYGAAGKPPKIPPKATLHFIVELYRID